MLRNVPSQNAYDDRRTRLYELGPDEIAQIIAKDSCSNGRFKDLPTHTESHRQPLLHDPADMQAVLDMQRLHVVSENMGYIVWGKSLTYRHPYASKDAAHQHGLVLAKMARLHNTYPHLDFDSLVARIDPHIAKHDHVHSEAAQHIGHSPIS